METLKKKTKRFSSKIKSVKKDVLIETNEGFLDVEIEITDGKEFTEIRKLAFPFGESSEKIKGSVKKYVETFNADAELADKSEKNERLNSQADEVIKDLEGITI